MKRLLLLLLTITIVTSCGSYSSYSSSPENESFLVFIETTTQYNVVDVKINNSESFLAKTYNRGENDPTRIQKIVRKSPEGKIFSVPTGKQKITVTFKDNVIFEKHVFLNNQEVRKIILP